MEAASSRLLVRVLNGILAAEVGMRADWRRDVVIRAEGMVGSEIAGIADSVLSVVTAAADVWLGPVDAWS